MGARRLAWHRTLGRASYLLVAAVLASMVLLAHSRLQGHDGEAYGIQTYVLYLQASLTIVFALSYGLALWTRRTVALHARFMIGTGLTLVDPVVIRLMFWLDQTPTSDRALGVPRNAGRVCPGADPGPVRPDQLASMAGIRPLVRRAAPDVSLPPPCAQCRQRLTTVIVTCDGYCVE